MLHEAKNVWNLYSHSTQCNNVYSKRLGISTINSAWKWEINVNSTEANTAIYRNVDGLLTS